jgi:hypothetical protein
MGEIDRIPSHEHPDDGGEDVLEVKLSPLDVVQ